MIRYTLLLSSLVLLASCSGPAAEGVECGETRCQENQSCVEAVCRQVCDITSQCTGSEVCEGGACLPVVCGDRLTSDGEECDDGNTINTDACLDTCMIARCGDGQVWSGTEDCDDGNTVTELCAVGEASCTVCNATCHSVAGVPVCNATCTSAGATECDSGTGQTRVCEDDGAGCLTWSAYTACGEGFCADATSCGTCNHGCSAVGVQECVAGQQSSCEADGNGCRAWGSPSACQDGFCADATTCGWISLAGGDYHHCAAVEGGVACWGVNWGGLLGIGNEIGPRSTPMQVAGLGPGSQVTSVAAGRGFTCAIVNGAAQCWGENDEGQLGNGDSSGSPSAIPDDVVGLTSGVSKIGAGSYFACAVVNGAARCWGENASGQLGDGSGPTASNVPVDVTGLSSGVTDIDAGESSACAVVNGGVKCWGGNQGGNLGDGMSTPSASPVDVCAVGESGPCSTLLSGVTQLSHGSADAFIVCAVANGGVVCWGDGGEAGNLGDDTGSPSAVPVQALGLTTGVTKVEVSWGHACAIKDGELWCWGNNENGQLGNGGTDTSESPIKIPGLADVTEVTLSSYGTCAVAGGVVKCWGDHGSGQAGLGGVIGDTKVSGPLTAAGFASGVTAVGAGASSTCAVASGAAQCWGYNVDGRLGNGDLVRHTSPVPVTGLGTGVTSIVVGNEFSCAIHSDQAKCWGKNNTVGHLGDDTFSGTVGSSTPVGVCDVGETGPCSTFLTGLSTSVSAMSSYGGHTCVLDTNGSVICWGAGSTGSIGDGAGVHRDVPVLVGLGTGNKAIAGGWAHTCAIDSTDHLSCWGANLNGELGGDVAVSQNSPVLVCAATDNGAGDGCDAGVGLGNVTAIAAGSNHTCAIISGGRVMCWGSDSQGQLGNPSIGTGSPLAVPVCATGQTDCSMYPLTGATAIATGAYFTCAIVTGGAVKCWGDNQGDTLGDGSGLDAATPVDVVGINSGATFINSGNTHTCAIVTGGLKCWGSNSQGKLGDGLVGEVHAPTDVAAFPYP